MNGFSNLISEAAKAGIKRKDFFFAFDPGLFCLSMRIIYLLKQISGEECHEYFSNENRKNVTQDNKPSDNDLGNK